MSGLQIISIPFVALWIFVVAVAIFPESRVAEVSHTIGQTEIPSWEWSDWWSNLGREKAERTCTKESFLAPSELYRRAYYRLCLEEKGFAE